MTYTLRSKLAGDFWLNLPDGPDGKKRAVRIPPRGMILLNEEEYRHVDVQAALRAEALTVIRKD